MIRPGDDQAKQSLLLASREIAKTVGELALCGEQLKSESGWVDTSEPAVIAENELLGAANSIEAAAVKLSQLRPRQVHVSH